jgi:hypothetical protein
MYLKEKEVGEMRQEGGYKRIVVLLEKLLKACE